MLLITGVVASTILIFHATQTGENKNSSAGELHLHRLRPLWVAANAHIKHALLTISR